MEGVPQRQGRPEYHRRSVKLLLLLQRALWVGCWRRGKKLRQAATHPGLATHPGWSCVFLEDAARCCDIG